MIDFSLAEYIPLIVEVIESGGEFRLYPRGTSMRPLLRQGIDSVALVRPGKLRRGDILLYVRPNGQYVLHRLMRKKRNGSLLFSGDNHRELEKGIADKDIIASVAAVYRGENRYECHSFGMRAYFILMTFSPFKYMLLLVRRVKYALLHLFRSES